MDQATSFEALTLRQRRLSLAAIISSVFSVGVAFGALVPLVTLLLEQRGVDTTVIGLNAAMFPIATLTMGLFVPRIIGRLGTLTSLYASVVMSSSLVLLFPLFPDVAFWFVLRFLIGAVESVAWVVTETWLNSITTERNRGVIMGIYATVLAGGFAVGPLLLSVVGTEGWPPFVIVSASLMVSIVPIFAARGVAPPMPHRAGHGPLRIARMAPLIIAGAIVGGQIDNAIFTLLPVYGLRVGMEQETAVLLLTVFIGGNLLLQVPLGWIADKTGRRRMLMVCVAVSLIGAAILPLFAPGGAMASEVLLWVLLFVWGGTAFGVYTIGISLLADRFPRELLAGANTAFIMAYECGTLTGPVIAGAAMDAIGADGLVVTVGLICAAFLGFNLLHRLSRGSGGERASVP
jgi:MFS family permease